MSKQSNRAVEYRHVGTVELRAGDGEAPRLAGLAAPYYDGTEGTEYELWPGVRERYSPGCFDESMKQDDIRALFNHDPSQLLGRNRSGTLRLTSSTRGLEYEVDIDQTRVGQDVYRMAKRGDLDGSSCGWYVTKESWTRSGQHEIRTIEKANLFDVSPVTYPAYQSTDVQARSLDTARESYQRHVESQEEATGDEQVDAKEEQGDLARERDAACAAVQLVKIRGIDTCRPIE